jgi:hypothetical protein
MTPISTINAAAVRLNPVDAEMGVGEGCETCLAANELFGVPTWAALGKRPDDIRMAEDGQAAVGLWRQR